MIERELGPPRRYSRHICMVGSKVVLVETHARLESARGEMLDRAKQTAERERWRRAPWQSRITTTLRAVINVAALEAYATTPDANRVPVNKHGKPYDGTGRQLIERLLARVDRPTPGSTFGTVDIVLVLHASVTLRVARRCL